MKYHAYLNANPGINAFPVNLCQLLDFSPLKLGSGGKYAAHAADREILAVILGGKADFTINGTNFKSVGGRPSIFTGPPTRWLARRVIQRITCGFWQAISASRLWSMIPIWTGWAAPCQC